MRRCTGPAVVSGDERVVRVSLYDSRRDSTYPGFGDKLHADPCVGIRILQVEDQLGEVFDGVYVMMRRRTYKAHPGASLRYPFVDLVAGKLTTLAGLRPLGHLDLDFVGVRKKVVGRPNRPDAICLIAERFESPFASGGADAPTSRLFDLPPMRFIAIGEGLMSLLRDRAKAHCTRGKAVDDRRGGLDSGAEYKYFLEARRPCGCLLPRPLILDVSEAIKCLLALGEGNNLEVRNGLRVRRVGSAPLSPIVVARIHACVINRNRSGSGMQARAKGLPSASVEYRLQRRENNAQPPG